MPECPRCGHEYSPETLVCTNCELPIETLPDTVDPNQEEFETLVRANTENEARVIQGLLLNAGIPVWVHTHGTAEALPMVVGEQGWADVKVPPGRLEEAQTVLNAASTVTAEELATEAEAAGHNLTPEARNEL